MHFPTDTLIDCPHLTGKLLNLIYITTIIITLCMGGNVSSLLPDNTHWVQWEQQGGEASAVAPEEDQWSHWSASSVTYIRQHIHCTSVWEMTLFTWAMTTLSSF